jgi:3' terminal RNA ribose 2'-O-methyltransferase Hen1
LSDLLSHLYVLIPVLDDQKHYYVSEDEIDKLLRHGEGWLASHPARRLIVSRYLKRQRSLADEALSRLMGDEPSEHEGEDRACAAPCQQAGLHQQRLRTVATILKESGARRVLDLGCGTGALVLMLLSSMPDAQVLGMDVSHRALEVASERVQRLPARQRERMQLIQGSLIYRDQRLSGYDAAAVVEVIEHLNPPRLAAFERAVFEFARPNTVIVTTPNRDYNVQFEKLPTGQLRHPDHRFEHSRVEFLAWATRVARRFDYSVQVRPLGPEDPQAGAPSQIAVFETAPADTACAGVV